MRLQALSMCVCQTQEQIRTPYFFSTADQFLLLMLQVACRPTCVDRGAGGAAAVGSGRTLLDFFEPKSATDGAKESPVLMDSSSDGGASGDADVVAMGVVNRGEGGAGAGSDADVVVTGVVSKGEGGAGAGSLADVVAMGVVNALEDSEGAGIDMDGVFSDAADGSSPADRTLVHDPPTARDYVRLSGSLFSNTTHQLSMVMATRGCRRRLG